MAHLEEAVGQERFQDKEVCEWEDSLEFEPEFLVPDSIERLFNFEKDLLPFKVGGYSVNESVTLLDGGVKGEKAKLMIGDCVG